jgi:hypothetical protein
MSHVAGEVVCGKIYICVSIPTDILRLDHLNSAPRLVVAREIVGGAGFLAPRRAAVSICLDPNAVKSNPARGLAELHDLVKVMRTAPNCGAAVLRDLIIVVATSFVPARCREHSALRGGENAHGKKKRQDSCRCRELHFNDFEVIMVS